jgi:hypothetical protein
MSLSYRRSQEDLNRAAWTHANRVRRSVSSEIEEREFEIVPLVAVDAMLADRGIDDWTNNATTLRPLRLVLELREFSQLLRDQCREAGLPYVDGSQSFADAIAEAATYLGSAS